MSEKGVTYEALPAHRFLSKNITGAYKKVTKAIDELNGLAFACGLRGCNDNSTIEKVIADLKVIQRNLMNEF